MILRELIASFGIGYDDKGGQQAERRIATLQSSMDELATIAASVFSAAAVAAPFIGLVSLASDANEALNLLEVSFEDSTQSVLDWADSFSKSSGRSKFSLRELAAEFGGFLKPVTDSTEQAAKMSQQLSELAVDLGSLRNIPVNEALVAFRSALSGETEAVKRFGVDLKVGAQEQEALRLGLGKNLQALNKNQLALIRYNILMRDLSFVTGDAAKTSKGYANATRALLDDLKTVGTELGLFLVPGFENLIQVFRGVLAPVKDMISAFKKYSENTELATAVTVALSLVVTSLLLPALGRLFKFSTRVLIPLTLLVLIFEDLIKALKTGDSFFANIGKSLDSMEGRLQRLRDTTDGWISGLLLIPQFLLFLVNELRAGVGQLMAVVAAAWEGLTTGNFNQLKNVFRTINEDFSKDPAVQSLVNGVKRAGQIGSVFLPEQKANTFIAPTRGGGTVVQQGNASLTLNISQFEGEDPEAFAARALQKFREELDQRDQEMLGALGLVSGATP